MKTKFIKNLVVLLFFLILSFILPSNNVRAISFSEVTGSLDWSTLSIQADPGMEINWTYEYFNHDTGAGNGGGSVGDSAFGETYSMSSVDGAMAQAGHIPGLPVYSAYSQAEATQSESETWSEGLTNHDIFFDITDGSGYVTVSIEYERYANIQTESVGDWASGHISGSINLFNYSQATRDRRTDNWMYTFYDGDGTTGGYPWHTLTATLWFEDGDEGHIWGYAYAKTEAYCATAPVPEPSTILLFSSGLICFARFRKRRIK